MITKQHLKTRPVCKVTFEHTPSYEAQSIALVASFNGWEPVPFKKLKSGKWKLEVEVEPGTQLQFRYHGSDGDQRWWDNEPQADREVPNPFGGTNSSIDC